MISIRLAFGSAAVAITAYSAIPGMIKTRYGKLANRSAGERNPTTPSTAALYTSASVIQTISLAINSRSRR